MGCKVSCVKMGVSLTISLSIAVDKRGTRRASTISLHTSCPFFRTMYHTHVVPIPPCVVSLTLHA